MLFKKKTIVIIIAILALFAGVVTFFALKNSEKLDSIISIYDETKNRSGIYVNSDLVGFVDGKAELNNNMDNSTIVISTEKSIFILNEKNINKIAENMTLVDIANHSEEMLLKDAEGVLYIYKNKEIEKITDEKINIAVISGDGSTYAYSTDEQAVYYNGKEEIYENIVISHLSSDGKLAYATKSVSKTEFQLFVLQNSQLKIIDEKAMNIVGLNSTGTELVYITAEGTFVYVDGKDKYKVAEENMYDIYYYDDKNLWYGDFWSVDTIKGSVCLIVPEDELTVSKICKISDTYVAEMFVEQCYEFIGITRNMSKVFYKGENNNLYRIDTKLGAEADLLAESVDLVRMSTDGSRAYFTRQDGQKSVYVFLVEKGLKEKQLAYVFDFFDIIVFDKYSYLEAKDIYVIKNEEIDKCEELGDLECFFIDYLAQVAYGYDDNCVYEIKKGKKIKLDGEYKNITAYDYVY